MTLRKPAAIALLAAPVVIAACTFVVQFEDKVSDDSGTIDEPFEASVDAPPTPRIDGGQDATPPVDPCANNKDGFKWGPKPTDRCCGQTARSFDSYSDSNNCGVCGFKCAPGQDCARSKLGTFFCVGCKDDGGLDQNVCPITGCCSDDRTTSAVFEDPMHQNRGVCSASNCASVCGTSCPPPSVCRTSMTTSYFCAYPGS